MLLDIFLILLIMGLIFLFIERSAQYKKLKIQFLELENQLTKQQQLQEEFSLIAERESSNQIPPDFLTGLPRRETFDDRLLQALNQSKRFEKSFAMMHFDINKFNLINNAQSYDVGDKVLKEVATRLQAAIRQIDTVSRFSADDFLFLLPQLSIPETAAYVAQRILDAIALPFIIDDHELFINASIGIAIYPYDGNDTETLLKNVDLALHRAKSMGENKYQFYQQELSVLSQRELSLASYLRSEDLLQKLFVNYQPFININTNQTVLVQALPGMQHPEFGLISFSELTKVAEHCGKIIDIGDWLLTAALAQFQKWNREGFMPDTLAINVTLRQIESSHFIYRVLQILEEFKVNPDKIVFEIAEGSLTADGPKLEKTFSMLIRLGVKISISVISLGNYALQKITKLPINYLKIDGKLVQKIMNEEENEALLEMIVLLAKNMDLSVIAEAVDHKKQKLVLQQLGCEIMQGKLFTHALPENMVK